MIERSRHSEQNEDKRRTGTRQEINLLDKTCSLECCHKLHKRLRALQLSAKSVNVAWWTHCRECPSTGSCKLIERCSSKHKSVWITLKCWKEWYKMENWWLCEQNSSNHDVPAGDLQLFITVNLLLRETGLAKMLDQLLGRPRTRRYIVDLCRRGLGQNALKNLKYDTMMGNFVYILTRNHALEHILKRVSKNEKFTSKVHHKDDHCFITEQTLTLKGVEYKSRIPCIMVRINWYRRASVWFFVKILVNLIDANGLSLEVCLLKIYQRLWTWVACNLEVNDRPSKRSKMWAKAFKANFLGRGSSW